MEFKEAADGMSGAFFILTGLLAFGEEFDPGIRDPIGLSALRWLWKSKYRIGR